MHHGVSSAQLLDPARQPLVTFDNNVLIALRRNEPSAPAVRELLALNERGLINVNITSSTAMEAQRADDRLEWQEHIAWLQSLGITQNNIFTSSRSVGFATPGEPNTVTFAPFLEVELVERIHTILFPRMPFMWRDYRDHETAHLNETQKQAVLELDDMRWGPIYIPPRATPTLDALSTDERERLKGRFETLSRKWMNAKNDALGFHAHLTLAWHTPHPEHAVFVTRDHNFRKRTKLDALRAIGYRGEILPVEEALAFLLALTGDWTESIRPEGGF